MVDTPPAAPTSGSRRERLLDWKSGWPLWVGLILAGIMLVFQLVLILETQGWRLGGIPAYFVSNGFDLATAIVPVERIHRGENLDFLKALNDPDILHPLQLADLRRHFLVDGDRVVGVTLNGESRAYPIRTLVWHEICNDTLGGIPVAVTYSGLADCAMVFDRRVAGEVLEMRVSGLLLHSNLLLYDYRHGFADRSLWSQLERRAVSGPAAARGDRLTIYGCSILPWGDWKALRPDTTVIDGREQLYKKCYGQNRYEPYFQAEEVRFDPTPLPPPEPHPPFARVLVVADGAGEKLIFFSDIAASARDSGSWETRIGDRPVTLHYRASFPETAWLTAVGGDAPAVFQSFWFPYYAARGGAVPPPH